jgi:hypothetical protein
MQKIGYTARRPGWRKAYRQLSSYIPTQEFPLFTGVQTIRKAMSKGTIKQDEQGGGDHGLK